VRDIDVRLGEIDRERRERRQRAPADPSAGCCLTCRSPFRADARFCWQCGAQLVPPSVGDEQPTAVIAMRADGS
jgi:predicted amidophosphoribosyltransferase